MTDIIGLSGFKVTVMTHNVHCRECMDAARFAITYARASGSTGSTYTLDSRVIGQAPEVHSATVKRVEASTRTNDETPYSLAETIADQLCEFQDDYTFYSVGPGADQISNDVVTMDVLVSSDRKGDRDRREFRVTVEEI